MIIETKITKNHQLSLQYSLNPLLKIVVALLLQTEIALLINHISQKDMRLPNP